MDFAVQEYPKIAVVLATAMLVLATWAVLLLRHDPGEGRRGSVMSMLAMILVGSMLVGVLSALRVAGVADALGVGLEDRLFRVALIALRLFIVGALAYVIWLLRKEDGR
ncbi:MAG: hypothetical protein ACOYB2_10565 [Limnohabitans sp.]